MAKHHRQVQSVSVSPELKAHMDKVKQNVNWSAIACRAFEEKLAELTPKPRTIWMLLDNPTQALIYGLGPYTSRDAAIQERMADATPVRFVEQP